MLAPINYLFDVSVISLSIQWISKEFKSSNIRIRVRMYIRTLQYTAPKILDLMQTTPAVGNNHKTRHQSKRLF